MESQICKICNIEKPFSEFDKNKNYSSGYIRFCKLCRNEKNRINYLKNTFKGDSFLSLHEIESEVEEAERILICLGFELNNKDNPVHKQFNQRLATKYNLK